MVCNKQGKQSLNQYPRNKEFTIYVYQIDYTVIHT